MVSIPSGRMRKRERHWAPEGNVSRLLKGHFSPTVSSSPDLTCYRSMLGMAIKASCQRRQLAASPFSFLTKPSCMIHCSFFRPHLTCFDIRYVSEPISYAKCRVLILLNFQASLAWPKISSEATRKPSKQQKANTKRLILAVNQCKDWRASSFSGFA